MSTIDEHEIQEGILQFYSQIKRVKNDNEMQHLSAQLLYLLSTSKLSQEYLTILYKMIGQTRDIVEGKGECAISYMMIYTWYKIFPYLAKKALDTFVLPTEDNKIPYGSWKDMKYFCDYCKTHNGGSEYHPLILHCVQLINRQLWLDSLQTDSSKLSLVAKWIPRERSKYGWLFKILAKDYFAAYYAKAHTTQAVINAHLKAKMNYRKILAKLNRQLDIVEVKQCANAWESIHFHNLSSNALSKYRMAFLNIHPKDKTRQRTIKDDRIQCAENFRAHLSHLSEKRTPKKCPI